LQWVLFKKRCHSLGMPQRLSKPFKTGSGLPWGEHDPDLFVGTERFFKPNYNYNLVSSWIPSLNNGKVQQKLEKERAPVAGVGCGRYFDYYHGQGVS
jgi:hypothetical protein